MAILKAGQRLDITASGPVINYDILINDAKYDGLSKSMSFGPYQKDVQYSYTVNSGEVKVLSYLGNKVTNGSAADAGFGDVRVGDQHGSIVISNGTDFNQLSFVRSDSVPTDTKQLTTTGQVVFTKGKVVALTLLSGSITELTLRDGLVQTYTDANTTDNTVFTTASLVVGERLTMPIPFFFGLHATIVGASPVISLEVSA